jgi:polysaccharide biosynthesis transport protein
MSGEPLRSVPAEVKRGTLVEGRARRKSVPPAARMLGPRITPQLVLYAMSRWWLYALPLGIGLALIGALAAQYLMPRTYRASVWIQIEADRPILAYELPDSRKFVRNQLALLKSPLVLNDVLQQPNIAELPEILESRTPLALLEKGLSIQAVDGSDIYQVSFITPHQQHAAIIADAIADSYFNQKDALFDKESKETIDRLRDHMKEREEKLAEKRREVQELAHDIADSHEVPWVDPTDRDLIDRSRAALAPLQNRLREAEVERSLLEARREVTGKTNQQQGDAPPQQLEGSLLAETDSLLQRLRGTQMELQSRIARSVEVNGWGPDHPRLKLMKTELEETQNAIAARRDELARRTNLQQSHRDQQTQKELEEKIRLQDELQNRVRDQIESERKRLLSGLLSEGDDKRMELAFRQMELQRIEEVYNLLYTRISAMETENSAAGRISRLKAARDNDVVIHSEPGPKVLAGLMLGLLAPFGLAILYEVRLQRITHGDQLAEESELPLIAEISRIPLQTLRETRNDRLGVNQALFEESIDQLRTSLMVPDELQEMQVVATVSAVSGEGKSSVASQLALSLARATQEPVLLIDGDTRSPSLHETFRLPLEPGVVDFLRGRSELAEVVQHFSDLVHVVAAGELDTNPSALITSVGIRKLIDEARPHYRYIIIDCPPVLAASEAYVLAKAADAALVCAMRDVSRGHQVKKACSRLQSVGVRTLGMILSGVPTFSYRYYYGSYYYGKDRESNGRSRKSGRRSELPFRSRAAVK